MRIQGHRDHSLSRLQADVEARDVAVAAFRRLQGQLPVALSKYIVPRISQLAADALLRVWRRGKDLVGERVVEEELRGELGVVRPNLEMDVHGAALIPPGINRHELGFAR